MNYIFLSKGYVNVHFISHFILLRLFKGMHFKYFIRKGYFFQEFDPTLFEIFLAYFVIMFAPKKKGINN